MEGVNARNSLEQFRRTTLIALLSTSVRRARALVLNGFHRQ